MIRLLLHSLILGLSLCCLLPSEGFAQRRTSGTSLLSGDELLGEVWSLYQNYRFAEAKAMIDKHMATARRQHKDLSSEWTELRAQIERAEHLAQHPVQVHLLDTLILPVSILVHGLEGMDISASWGLGMLDRALEGWVDERGVNRLVSYDHSGQRDLRWEVRAGGQWQVGQEQLSALNTSVDELYPTLLQDGQTILFARRDVEGLGGYDIYQSRYNWEKGEAYKPTLLGMPFSSPSDDYLLAYDATRDRGILLSNRGVVADSLRLFLFAGNPLSASSLERQEESDSIDMPSVSLVGLPFGGPSEERTPSRGALYLPLRNGTVITDWSQWHSAKALELYREYLDLQRELTKLRAEQYHLRSEYRGSSQRADLSGRLYQLEEQIAKLQSCADQKLVESKNTEIIYRKLQ